jgi:hypothetical protein
MLRGNKLPEVFVMNLIAVVCAGAISGIFMPLFSHLPILNSINYFPCGWMWLSGIVSVALYRWLLEEEQPLTGSDGVITGIFTGVVASFTSLILAILLGNNGSTLSVSANIAPIIEELERTFELSRLQSSSFTFLFLTNLTFYPIISGFSGFIGVTLLGKSRTHGKMY